MAFWVNAGMATLCRWEQSPGHCWSAPCVIVWWFGCHQPSTDCHLWAGWAGTGRCGDLPWASCSLQGSAWRQKEIEGEGRLLASLALQRELESAVGRHLSRETFTGPGGSQITERAWLCVMHSQPQSVRRMPFHEHFWPETEVNRSPCSAACPVTTVRSHWRQICLLTPLPSSAPCQPGTKQGPSKCHLLCLVLPATALMPL